MPHSDYKSDPIALANDICVCWNITSLGFSIASCCIYDLIFHRKIEVSSTEPRFQEENQHSGL